MISELDHLVWGAPDLDAGIEIIAERFQAEPFTGGRHPGVGTRNALLGLSERIYFEILAPDPEQSVFTGFGQWVKDLARPGLLTWAGRAEDLVALSQRVEHAGLVPGEILSMGRLKPDGSRLSWKLMTVGGHDQGLLVPFFIEWHDSHPCDSLPAAATLDRLILSSPEPEELVRIMEVLGIAGDVDVRRADHSGLEATLHDPSGRPFSVPGV